MWLIATVIYLSLRFAVSKVKFRKADFFFVGSHNKNELEKWLLVFMLAAEIFV